MTKVSTLQISRLRDSLSGIVGYDVVRSLLGLVLLIAAALKGYQLATEPVANNSIFTSRWFLIAQVEFELMFGLLLLSGLYKRLMWMVVLVCFAGFSLITLYKGLAGAASCGCFGKVEVNPWYTLIFDLAAVSALLIFRPNGKHRQCVQFHWFRSAMVAAVALVAGIPGGLAMASYIPAAVTAQGDIIGDGQIVVLEPQTWVGKRFPLLKYIDIGDKLAEGKWLILLFHHDCPDCCEAIPLYEQIAKEMANRKSTLGIALVEMPPYGQPGESPISMNSPCTLGSVSDVKEWLVETPAAVMLADGKVKYAGDGAGEQIENLLTNAPTLFESNGYDENL